jgi:CO/xanthine dehydrogenase FAD-binding subunit
MIINRHNTHILHTFQYHNPTSVVDACKLLSDLPEDTRIIAGGTDIIPKMKEDLLRPSNVVNIKNIPGLSGIDEKDNCIQIGALTKIREIEKNSLIQKKANILHHATRIIGSIQVRNLATIGGNLCNASPAADGAAALIALNAEVTIRSHKRVRCVNLETFFEGPGKSILDKDEILTLIQFPTPKKDAFSYYRKLGRVSLDLATVSLAIQARVDEGKISEFRIVAGSVAPIPLRLKTIEDSLIDRKLTEDLIQLTANQISEEIKPITDIRGSASYRKSAIKGLVKEAFYAILGKKEGS